MAQETAPDMYTIAVLIEELKTDDTHQRLAETILDVERADPGHRTDRRITSAKPRRRAAF